MKMTKPPQAKVIWRGTCQSCKAEFEATAEELAVKLEYSPQESKPFAHADCSVCGAKTRQAIVFYPFPVDPAKDEVVLKKSDSDETAKPLVS